MAYYFAEGSKFYFSSTFAGAKTISAATNANPASLSSTSHGYSDNDEVLFSSGWEDATDSVYRADQQNADTFTLLGLDTSSTVWFPAGSGTGSTYKISAWTEIPQVINVTAAGGDARFTPVELLGKRNSISVPTGFNPATFTLTLAHDPANANYLTMVGLARTLTKVALKISLGGGGTAYGYGHMSVSEIPQLARNQVNTVQAAISMLGRFVSYST